MNQNTNMSSLICIDCAYKPTSQADLEEHCCCTCDGAGGYCQCHECACEGGMIHFYFQPQHRHIGTAQQIRVSALDPYVKIEETLTIIEAAAPLATLHITLPTYNFALNVAFVSTQDVSEVVYEGEMDTHAAPKSLIAGSTVHLQLRKGKWYSAI